MEKESLVMVVEDKKDQAYFLAKILAVNGYRVVWASNGHQALDMIMGGLVPDLLVTDLRMPSMNGFELMEELKRNNVDICTIVTSASDKDIDFEAAFVRGSKGYLVKPISPSKLISSVNRIVNREISRP